MLRFDLLLEFMSFTQLLVSLNIIYSVFDLCMLPRLTGSLQAPGGGAFPGLLSFSPGMPSFSTAASPAALSGLHNPAMQSALLQVTLACLSN